MTDQRHQAEIRSVLWSLRDCFRLDYLWQEKAVERIIAGASGNTRRDRPLY